MVVLRALRSLGASTGFGLLLLCGYTSCVPDLDALASGSERDGALPWLTTDSGSDVTDASAAGTFGLGGTDAGVGATAGGRAGSGGRPQGGAAASGGDGQGGAMNGGGAGAQTSDGGSGASCDAGLVSCPGMPACTTNLMVGDVMGATMTNCGSCGVTCALTNASSATCSNGDCVPTCRSGFDDCDTTKNDGCETDIDGDDSNCGGCGTTCSDPSPACREGSCVVQGLVQFSIPFTQANLQQRYGDVFETPADLATSTVTLRMYAPGALAGTLYVYLTDSNFVFSSMKTMPLSELNSGWQDVSLSVPAATPSFDSTSVRQVTIEFWSDSSGPWANPTLVYVDRVHSANLAVDETFDGNVGGMVKSTQLVIAGSTLSWVDTLP